MNALYIEELNQRFGQSDDKGQIRFKMGKGDIPVVEIENEQASALISCQGAHVLSWRPDGQEEVIWVSREARYAKGQSVRGGIPICWPWFGAHSENTSFPAHGFARTVLWEITEACQLDSGETQISFILNTSQLDDTTRKTWPESTSALYVLTIGHSLKLELITQNNGVKAICVGEALHTYFNVGDVSKTSVTGLHGKDYLDKPDGFKRKKQSGDIGIDAEVDRVYLNTTDELSITGPQRKIVISKQGSHSTIVWNPWKQVAEKMGDLGEGGYLNMLCVESGNAADDVVTIKPGESHTLQVVYRVENN
ncbi:MAG: D-hexose-6-phosphate mutarotase [endosymbiont of Galathealinum brachiosum]|uniref:Putative glucose-6-phosphate 1-epimerase n=1 Tax=endosymbiont of Galathealinum brachiosum TaxID=2200906 RepID=A0A370DJ89_9GAMM|nr:MAG: D-hexose-6-phosphate mutarotase [endosymbiont of Galathealinum brachiosum]